MALNRKVLTMVAAMGYDELHELNLAVVDAIRTVLRAENLEKAAQFRVGDIVEFNTKKRGVVRIKVARVGATLSGNDIVTALRWRVSASICRKLG